MKRSLFHLCLRFGVLIGLLLGLVPSLEARPDFTASEITVGCTTVLEGDVAHFKLWLRNVGDENPNWTLEVATKPKKILIGMKLGTSYLFPASPPSAAKAARVPGVRLSCGWRGSVWASHFPRMVRGTRHVAVGHPGCGIAVA